MIIADMTRCRYNPIVAAAADVAEYTGRRSRTGNFHKSVGAVGSQITDQTIDAADNDVRLRTGK